MENNMNRLISQAKALLPDYIDEKYPKNKDGYTPGRGEATVHITLFLLWLEKQI
jgi:hypothetical protein